MLVSWRVTWSGLRSGVGSPTSSWTRYGCPFLYAECRLYYGSVLLAKGRWEDADRELTAGVRITAGACPGLHARALTRLARLRVRQGRLEDAAHILAGVDVDGEAEAMLSLAAMLIARGDAQAASRQLQQRLQHVAEHRFHLAAALDLLIDACLSRRRADGRHGRRSAQRSSSAAPTVTARGAGCECPRPGVDRPGRQRGGGHRAALRGGDVVSPRAAVRAGSRPARPRPGLVDTRATRRSTTSAGRSPVSRSLAPSSTPIASPPSSARWVCPLAPAPRVAGADRSRATGAPAPVRRPLQPRDRPATARQPQDRGAPRESHPHQAQLAQPGRDRAPMRCAESAQRH